MSLLTNSLIRASAACALGACVQIGYCQFGHTVDSRHSGSGILHAYGRDYHPNEVTVTLSSGGRATISTNRTTFYGRWQGGGNQVNLRIDRVHGASDENDRATGDGRVSFNRNGDWSRVVLSGRNLTDRNRFSLDFTADLGRRRSRPWWNPPRNRRPRGRH